MLIHKAVIPYPLHPKVCYGLEREFKKRDFDREGGKTIFRGGKDRRGEMREQDSELTMQQHST